MEEYGSMLDIIYDEGLEPDNTHGYSKLLLWNSSSPQSDPLLDLLKAFAYTLAAVASVTVASTSLISFFWKRNKTRTSQGQT
jgi:hypothetical protein